MKNRTKTENNGIHSKIETIEKWFRIVFIVVGPLYIFGIVIYKGIIDFDLNWFQASLLGFFLGLFVLGLLVLVEFGILAWDRSTTWVMEQLRKYPKIRRLIIIPLSAGIVFGSIYISVFYWPWDNLSRFVFFLYFGIFLPAALFSIFRDEKVREASRLSKQITPELIVNNPQASIEHAFTLFEEHLRKRIGASADVYGETLINLAFAANGKLVYSDVENENKGARNFVSGVYSIYRNPRKHRIVQDDEQSTLAIIGLIELLFRIVDQSKDNTTTNDQKDVRHSPS